MVAVRKFDVVFVRFCTVGYSRSWLRRPDVGIEMRRSDFEALDEVSKEGTKNGGSFSTSLCQQGDDHQMKTETEETACRVFLRFAGGAVTAAIRAHCKG
jgi:hypothetical protein